MAVHIPLSTSARAETFNLLLSCNHLLSPASGQPLLLPTQDMVLGCYYLTLLKYNKFPKEQSLKFNIWYSTISEILADYQSNKIHTHTPIWIKLNFPVQTLIGEKQSKEVNKPLEIRLMKNGNKYTYFQETYIVHESKSSLTPSYFYRTTAGRVLMNNLIYS